jgi:hypothetical protein
MRWAYATTTRSGASSWRSSTTTPSSGDIRPSSQSTPNAASRMHARRLRQPPSARPPAAADALGEGRGDERRDRAASGREACGGSPGDDGLGRGGGVRSAVCQRGIQPGRAREAFWVAKAETVAPLQKAAAVMLAAPAGWMTFARLVPAAVYGARTVMPTHTPLMVEFARDRTSLVRRIARWQNYPPIETGPLAEEERGAHWSFRRRSTSKRPLQVEQLAVGLRAPPPRRRRPDSRRRSVEHGVQECLDGTRDGREVCPAARPPRPCARTVLPTREAAGERKPGAPASSVR